MWWILVAAILFKSIYLLQYALASPFLYVPAADSEVYVMDVMRMDEHGLLGNEVFYRAPLYLYFIYPILKVCSFEPLPLLVIQLLLGVGILFLLYVISYRISGQRTGLLAAGLGLFYAPMTFYETKILATVLGMFLGLLSLYFLIRSEQDRRISDWVVGGIFLGLAIICRPHYLLVFPFFILGIALRYFRESKAWLVPVAIMVCMTAGMISVVTMRNYVVSGEFIPICANSGVTFAQGNTKGAQGSLTGIPGLSNDVATQHISAKQLAEKSLGRELAHSDVNRFWFAWGLKYITDNPIRYFQLLWQKALLILNNRELASCYLLEIDLRMFPILRVAFLPFGFILAWAVVGAFIFCRNANAPVILYATCIGTICTMLMFYVTTRYRMTLAPVAMIFAAVGIDYFISNWSNRKRVILIGSSVLVMLICATSACLPMKKEYLDSGDSGYWANLAIAYQTRAIALQNMKDVQSAADFHDKAREALGVAIQLEPREKMYQLMLLEQSLAQNPNNIQLQFNYAVGCYNSGRTEQALAVINQILSVDPNHAQAQALLENIRAGW